MSGKHDWALPGCNETRRQPPGPPPVVTRDGMDRLKQENPPSPTGHKDLESHDSSILVVLLAFLAASGLLAVSRQRAGRRLVVRFQAILSRYPRWLGSGRPSSSKPPLSFGSGVDYSFDFEPPGIRAISTAVELGPATNSSARSRLVNRPSSRTYKTPETRPPRSATLRDPSMSLESTVHVPDPGRAAQPTGQNGGDGETNGSSLRRFLPHPKRTRANRGVWSNRLENPTITVQSASTVESRETSNADSSDEEILVCPSASGEWPIQACFDKLTGWHDKYSTMSQFLAMDHIKLKRHAPIPFQYQTARSLARKKSGWTSSQVRVLPSQEHQPSQFCINHESIEINQIHFPIPLRLPRALAAEALVLRYTKLVKEAWSQGALPCLAGERTLGHAIECSYLSTAKDGQIPYCQMSSGTLQMCFSARILRESRRSPWLARRISVIAPSFSLSNLYYLVTMAFGPSEHPVGRVLLSAIVFILGRGLPCFKEFVLSEGSREMLKLLDYIRKIDWSGRSIQRLVNICTFDNIPNWYSNWGSGGLERLTELSSTQIEWEIDMMFLKCIE